MRLIAPITVTLGEEIPLAIIDDENYDLASSFRWHTSKTPDGRYYYKTEVKNKVIYMHRLIIGAKEEEEVDHINRITYDNRKINLRICNHSENSKNRLSRVDATSKYLGVHWSSRHKKWIAQLCVNYKVVFSYTCILEEQAALAYNDAAIKYHGDFANLNVIPDEKYHRMLMLLEGGRRRRWKESP